MSSRPDAFMPLWIGDYLADTTHLSTEQHGVCLLLLMEMHRSGGLPSDDATLAALAKVPKARWARMKGLIFETINRVRARPVQKGGAQ